MIKLRAAREEDLPRLRELWQKGFSEGLDCDYFFEHCFAPGHVESSLVLLDDEVVQSMVFFLPTFWYDGEKDDYGPLPYLVGLTTDKGRRHQKYASWLVETACDFMTEKGAGGVWTLLGEKQLELFFSIQGFWALPCAATCAVKRSALHEPVGTIRHAAPEAYEQVRETFLRGRSHVVAGPLVASIQRDLAERKRGGMFLMDLDGEAACAIAVRQGENICVRELLCQETQQEAALALLARELPAECYIVGNTSDVGMLRLMNDFAKMERPSGYLGCGVWI